MNRQQAAKRLDALRREYAPYEPAFRELARFLAPARGEFDGAESRQVRPDKKLLDSDPVLAAEVLAAGMMSGLTSPARRWYDLRLNPPDATAEEQARPWLEDVTACLNAVFHAAGLYGVLHGFYREIAVFGTAAFVLEPDFENVVRFVPLTAGEYYLGTGKNGEIDSFGRDFKMTAEDMAETFGEENLPPAVRLRLQRGETDERCRIHHLIVPNPKHRTQQKNKYNKKYLSLYWTDGMDEFLKRGGYDAFPVVAARWEVKNGSEIYGKGPGWNVLCDVKMLQKMQQTKILALDKNANPPMMVSSSVQGEVNLMPGGLTRYNGTTDSAVKPAYQVAVDLNALEAAISEVKRRIKSQFFVDVFMMLSSQDYSRMTATEVAERHQEKMLVLGPVLQRLEKELLDRTIGLVFNCALEAGILPPVPEILQGRALKVAYVSVVAQAQKAGGTAAIEQTVSFADSLAQAKPEALDRLDADKVLRDYADKLGTSALLAQDERVEQIRRMRAEQQAQAAQAQSVQNLLEGAKTAGQINTGPDSALGAVLEADRE